VPGFSFEPFEYVPGCIFIPEFCYVFHI
jgi:hypothetical protein